jgi:hypothetical protein
MMDHASISDNTRLRDRCGALRGGGGGVLLLVQRARLVTRRGVSRFVDGFIGGFIVFFGTRSTKVR